MKISKNNSPIANLKPKQVANWKIAIVMSRYNDILGDILLENTISTLTKNHIQSKNIEIIKVPGSLEIPFITKKVIDNQKLDALITLGIVIKGDTYHFDLVANETYRALMNINLTSKIPIIFGVLTVNNIKEAQDRINPKKLNKGEEFALSALEMINLNQKY